MGHRNHRRADRGHATDLVAFTPNGHVTQCRDCGTLRLRFGNALLHLDPSDLAQVRAAVRPGTVQPNRPRRIQPDEPRTVELYLDGSGVGFIFSHAEIAELDELLLATERYLVGIGMAVPSQSARGPAMAIDLPESIQRRLMGSHHGRS